MELNRETLLAKLKPHGQEHLLRFWDELNDARQAAARRPDSGD